MHTLWYGRLYLRRTYQLTDKPIVVPLIPECSACIVSSLQTLIPLLTDDTDEQARFFTHAYRKLMTGFTKRLEPVILSIDLYQELYKMGNKDDPYLEIKQRSIEAAEKVYPIVEEEISHFAGYDRFRAALAASIAGNVIDFNTAYHKPDLDALLEVFHAVMEEGFTIDDSEQLWQKLNSSKGKVVVLADNAGETHFDIPILELMKNLGWKITYVVKMKPMINDATREDISGTRIEELAKIADNGGWAHGVPRTYVSKEFLQLVSESDLVLSKGQANVETFPEIQRELGIETYYIIRAKCPHIAQAVGAKVGDNVVLRRPAF